MDTLRERLSEIGSPISDVQFNAYIRTSLSLTTHYQPLLTTLSTTARQTRTALTSDNHIWHLVEEASTIKLEASVNKSHATLAAAHGKFHKGGSGGSKSKDRKGKGKKSGPKCSKVGNIHVPLTSHDFPIWQQNIDLVEPTSM
jgi:hypothetical protein